MQRALLRTWLQAASI
ncbi:hypothetical protein [Bacillus sp. SIMBA_026]